jgi:hypothetical protein
MRHERTSQDDWGVEWIDGDGGIEVAIFSGPNGRERTLRVGDPLLPRSPEMAAEPTDARVTGIR